MFVITLLIVACSDSKNTRYQDTSHLEIPPEMEIVETPKAIVEDKDKDKVKVKVKESGLGDEVLLVGSAKKPVIKIKKLFDRSWNIVEQALKLNEIDVTDKNREQGVFYVLFDPDVLPANDPELMDKVTFFLFQDDFEEETYKVTVIWRESDTEISAELVEQLNTDLLDDDEDGSEGSVDEGAKLINTLYKTIRDDLPLD